MPHRRVTVRELRNDTSRLLDRIQDGDSVEVTRNGEVVAVLMPPHPDRQLIDALQRDGVLPPGWQESQGALRRAGALGPSYAADPGSPPAEEVISAGRADHP